MEFEKKEEKQPLQYIQLMYVGKEYTRTFDNNGVKTKGYKYKFKKSPEDQWARNVWGTDTTKGADTLEEGEFYTIGFIPKPSPQDSTKNMMIGRFFAKIDEAEKIADSTIEQTEREEISREKSEIDIWLDKIEPNKEGFLNAFYTTNGYEKFKEWVNTDKCETSYFRILRESGLLDEKGYEAAISSVYNKAIARFNETI